MKKSFLTLGLFLFAVTVASSATILTGNLPDATWDQAGSPYQVQGSAVIPAGSTVLVMPSAVVTFDPGASLTVSGLLDIRGKAAFPARFEIPAGGAMLNVKGGRLTATDAKFVGGILLFEDATVRIAESDITGGSGPYLRGATSAVFHHNKIYSNSSGSTLDGDRVKASFTYNAIVSNTYGINVKGYESLSFEYNSVHENSQAQVVNGTLKLLPLGKNYWGTTEPGTVAVNGVADLSPMWSLKEVLRQYVKTQLPSLPQSRMAKVAAAAKAEKAAAALKAKKAAAARKAAALADKKAAKAKEAAAAKAALDARISEIAPAETPVETVEIAPVETVEVSPAETPAAAPAEVDPSFGELEVGTVEPTPEATPEAPVATEPAAPVVEAPAAVETPVATEAVVSEPVAEAPVAEVEAPAVPSGETPDLPGAVTATEATPTPVVVESPATAPTIPAGNDSFNAGMIPAPPTNVPATSAAGLGLDLPPLNDNPIQPPTDLDLPPLE